MNSVGQMDFGVDPAQVDAFKETIKLDLIDKTKTSLEDLKSTVAADLPNAWVGDAAERFNNSIESAVTTAKNLLDDIYNAIEAEVRNIKNAVKNTENAMMGGTENAFSQQDVSEHKWSE